MASTTVTTYLLLLLLTYVSLALSYTYNPFFQFYQPYAYLPTHTPYLPSLPPFTNSIFETRLPVTYEAPAPPPPAMTVLAEPPHLVSTKFTAVPLMLMSKDAMKTVSDVQVMTASKNKPVLVVKTKNNHLMQCTPAVRIQLDKPIIVYSLRTSILFPSEIEIVHKRYKIPVKIGAVMAPVAPNTYVSPQTPVSVKVVYAIPTEPVSIDYVNNEDAVIVPETEAVIVESEKPAEPAAQLPAEQPPKNVTILEFPEKEAEPPLQVDEEDEELVNRNPPTVLAPAGIVQSTQPLAIVQPFHNSKESPVLIDLREEAKRKRI